MKRFLLPLVAVLLYSGVVAQEAKKSPSGASYTIVKPGTGKKLAVGDVITFNFTEKTSKDSLLASSKGTPAKTQIGQSQNIGDLMDVFPLLSVGDSVMISVPTDSIFKGHEESRPPFLAKGTPIIFGIHILKSQSMEEATAEIQKMTDSLKNGEKSAAAAYVTTNKLAVTTTPSGLMYQVTSPTAGIKPAKGDTVLVNYTGMTLDGKVFDSSVAEAAQKAGLNKPAEMMTPLPVVIGAGGVIPGWEEGLQYFGEGAKGTMIIPSDLAYGERGGGNTIKPYSTLRFDVEIVKVKKATPPEVLQAREKASRDSYLASQSTKFVTLPSGLMYNITTPAGAIKPVKGDTLVLNYTGMTLGGKVFDSSIQSVAEKAGLSQPGREYAPIRVEYGSGRMIPGWEEGLGLFRQGSKGTLIVPSGLAYGPEGAEDVIPPYSTLRFDIQVLKVVKPKSATAKPAVKAPVKKPAATVKPAAKKPAAKAPIKK